MSVTAALRQRELTESHRNQEHPPAPQVPSSPSATSNKRVSQSPWLTNLQTTILGFSSRGLKCNFKFPNVCTSRASQVAPVVKNLPANARCGFDPWVGKILWRRACNPLQYPCLETPMDREAWQGAVQRGAKSQTRLKQLSKQLSTDVFGFINNK